MALRDRNAQANTGGDPTAFDMPSGGGQQQDGQQQQLDQMQQQAQEEQQQQREQQQQQQDSTQAQNQTSDSTNTNTNAGSTASDAMSAAQTTLASTSNNANTNANTSTTTVDVKVSADVAGGDLGALQPMDSDMIDLDLSDSASIGDMFVATKGGEIEFNPGDDIDLSDILNGSLGGDGHDVGQVLVGTNTLNDADTLNTPTWNNENAVNFHPTNNGGDASTGPGVGMNGDSASAGGATQPMPFGGLRGSEYEGGGKGGEAGDAGATGGGNLGNWGNGSGDDSIDIANDAQAGGWMDHMSVTLNQGIVMGANVLGNSVDTTVVGGSMTSSYDLDEG